MERHLAKPVGTDTVVNCVELTSGKAVKAPIAKETRKQRSKEAKKQGNKEAKKQRSKEAKKQRNKYCQAVLTWRK